jgi:hypothetical protein
MSNKRAANVEVLETQNPEVAEIATSEIATPAIPTANFVLEYRGSHPQARFTYGVAGNPGRFVVPASLLAGGDQPGFVPPTTITVDVELVMPKAGSAKVDKAEAQAAKLAERAAKAQAKVEAAQAKVEARQAKAEAALAAARAKVEAALAKAAS